jgi:DNA-binding MarR family transcriptional regulator
MSRRVQAEQVGLRYLAVAYRLRKVLDEQMTAAGLSLARTKVLQVLDGQGAHRQALLAEKLGLAPRSVTQALEALERDKLVEREPDPSDLRAKLVAVTAEGSAALRAGTAAGEQVLAAIFDGLDQRQMADLDGLLALVEAATDAAAGAVAGDRTEPPSG